MKRILIIALPVLVAGGIVGFVCGYLQGQSSGCEVGVVWAGRSADATKAMRAMALLEVMATTNYPRVVEALNHDVDFALLRVLEADDFLKKGALPRTIRQEEEAIRLAFKDTGVDNGTFYRHLASFRQKHPSQSTDKDVLKALSRLRKEYGDAQPSAAPLPPAPAGPSEGAR